MERQSHQDPREAKRKPPFEPREQEHPGSEAAMGDAPDFGETSYVGLGRLEGKTLVKIKRYRRVATRYEKTAVNFLGFVLFASIRVWLA